MKIEVHVYHHHDEFLLSWLARLESEVKKIMATVKDIEDKIDALPAAIQVSIDAETAEVKAAIQALKDQIENGTSATQADLDTISSKLDNVGSGVEASVSNIFTPDAPAT